MGELRLKSRPTTSRSWAARRTHSAVRRVLSDSQLGPVDGDADVLHAGQHPHQRVLDLGVQRGHALRVERGQDGRREAADGERLPRRHLRRVGGLLAEVELPGRRRPPRAAGRRCSAPGGRRCRTGSRPGRAGRRRSRCRARGSGRRSRARGDSGRDAVADRGQRPQQRLGLVRPQRPPVGQRGPDRRLGNVLGRGATPPRPPPDRPRPPGRSARCAPGAPDQAAATSSASSPPSSAAASSRARRADDLGLDAPHRRS